MNRSLLAAALTIACLSTAHGASERVTNGSFESDAIANGSWGTYTSLAGWSGAPDIELRNNVAGQAFDGLNFVELDTGGNSAMSQAISTSTGLHYTLSFAYAARPHTGDTNDIAVYWNGTLLDTLGGSNAGANHAWAVYSYDVVGGAGASSLLSFAAQGAGDSLGGSLDAVSVLAAVPEPEAYALMLAGLGLVGFIARGRRRSA